MSVGYLTDAMPDGGGVHNVRIVRSKCGRWKEGLCNFPRESVPSECRQWKEGLCKFPMRSVRSKCRWWKEGLCNFSWKVCKANVGDEKRVCVNFPWQVCKANVGDEKNVCVSSGTWSKHNHIWSKTKMFLIPLPNFPLLWFALFPHPVTVCHYHTTTTIPLPIIPPFAILVLDEWPVVLTAKWEILWKRSVV